MQTALLELREAKTGICGEAGGLVSEDLRLSLQLPYASTSPGTCDQEWQAGTLSSAERSLEGALKMRQLSRHILPSWVLHRELALET